MAKGRRCQVTAATAGPRGEVASTGRVTAISRRSRHGQPRIGGLAQPPGQPVVRQQDRGRPGGTGAFVLRHPAQLGNREGGRRHAPGLLGPPGGTATFGDQLRGARADRRSFHSSAGLTTSPRSSSAIIPCCWPATPMAAAWSSRPSPARCSAAHHAEGSTQYRPDAARCLAPPLAVSAGRAQPWWTASRSPRQQLARCLLPLFTIGSAVSVVYSVRQAGLPGASGPRINASTGLVNDLGPDVGEPS